MDFFVFFWIWKFGSFKNSFATITSSSEIFFTFRRYILLVQTKKVISMNYVSSTSSWKLWKWVRLDLMLTMRDVDIDSILKPLAKFISNSRSTEFKDILTWNISQMIRKTILISTRIIISYVMERHISYWFWQKVNGKWENTMIKIWQ